MTLAALLALGGGDHTKVAHKCHEGSQRMFGYSRQTGKFLLPRGHVSIQMKLHILDTHAWKDFQPQSVLVNVQFQSHDNHLAGDKL